MEVKDYFEEVKRIKDAWYDTAAKKAIIAKYNGEFKKEADLVHYVLGKALELVKAKNEFDEDDFHAFDRYWNVPSTKKLKNALDEMSNEFVVAFAEYLKRTSKKYRYELNRLKTVSNYQNERAEKSNVKLQKIFELLIEKTETYKQTYINAIVDYEMKRLKFFEPYKEMEVFIGYKNQIVIRNIGTYNGPIPEKFTKRWVNIFNTIKIQSDNFNEAYYKELVIKDAEAKYLSNIETVAKVIANRLTSNPNEITVNYIGSDPKAFEMFINADGNNIHCRSIFCAEASFLVSPHWRFIATIKNN